MIRRWTRGMARIHLVGFTLAAGAITIALPSIWLRVSLGSYPAVVLCPQQPAPGAADATPAAANVPTTRRVCGYGPRGQRFSRYSLTNCSLAGQDLRQQNWHGYRTPEMDFDWVLANLDLPGRIWPMPICGARSC